MSIVDFTMVNERLEKILTQYRESPKLKHMIRTYLRQAEMAMQVATELPEAFDIDIAVGDQLTLLGKRMGWTREHCVCEVQPVFGFECEGVITEYPISGFCDDNVTWEECGQFGLGNVIINSDEMYRKFLKVRSYQMEARFDISSLTDCMKILFGNTATVLDAGHGRVVLAPGRGLTDTEIALLQLVPRVLPVAPGIETRFHFDEVKVFGFGTGWGGFCEDWEPNGTPMLDDNGDPIEDENAVEIITGPLTRDALWMCEFDVNPYDCG